jgi:hypothetical protein
LGQEDNNVVRKKPSALRLLMDALTLHFFPAVASAGFTVPQRYPMYDFGDSGEMYSGKLFEFFPPSELACLYCGVSKEREPELIIRLTAARFDGKIDGLDAAVERATLANEMAQLRILSSSRAPFDYLFVERPLGLLPRPWKLVAAKDPEATRGAAEDLAQRAARLLTAQMPDALRKVRAKPSAIISASGDITYTLCDYPPPAWFKVIEGIARLGLPKPGDPGQR